MAKKPKRPKHTKLVLPGEKKEKSQDKASGAELKTRDRVGRPLAGQEAVEPIEETVDAGFQEGTESTEVKTTKKEGSGFFSRRINKTVKASTSTAEETEEPGEDEQAEGVIRFSGRKSARVKAVRRKKARRRLRALVALLVVLAIVVVIISGVYRPVASALGDWLETVRISFDGGDGYPVDLALTGYIQSEPMGKNGIALLGDTDMVMISDTGKELNRIQHGYVAPGMSAGDTRVVVYSRGGTGYVVEGRSGNIAKNTTEQDILFAQMSPGGSLAVVTSSRSSATVQVLDNTYDDASPVFTWSGMEEKPIMASFHTDNKSLAVGCISASAGAIDSTVYLLHTSKADVQAAIEVRDALVLQLHYLSAKQLLVLYDRFAAVYDGEGRELYRYDYGDRALQTAHVAEGKAALVFGSVASQTVELVVLDRELGTMFTAYQDGTEAPRVLSAPDGVLLMLGQSITAYSDTGELLRQSYYEGTLNDLVYCRQPLALLTGRILPLESLFTGEESLGNSSLSVPQSSGAGSLTADVTPDTSDIDTSGQDEQTSRLPEP